MKLKDNLISREKAIDALNVGTELLRRVLDDTDVVGAERAKYEWGLGLIESYISDMKKLPSAQPEITVDGYADGFADGYKLGKKYAQPQLPEWAQKVEEYRKSAPSFVRNQLVWALYQTWKEYDGRLVHQRGKENR